VLLSERSDFLQASATDLQLLFDEAMAFAFDEELNDFAIHKTPPSQLLHATLRLTKGGRITTAGAVPDPVGKGVLR
jgi:hypothetical protein